jgi:NADPH-dependent 2,4-dienoyl-CoA reductase/sulfur reductase-like enzyme
MKKAGLKIPVVTVGGIQDLDEAEKILKDGKADAVSIARGLIADPELVKKAHQGRGEDVVPCIKCMRCHDSAVFEYRYLCSVNPEIGKEHLLKSLIDPAEDRKKVLVIGGGPAGMKAALLASARGHDVSLYEKSDSLGGILKSTEHIGFKGSLRRFKQFLCFQVMKSSIKVCLNTEATPKMIENEQADIVIAAIGSTPVIPPIKGVENKNVITAMQSYGQEQQLEEKIVVIGGGQVGCETGLHLARMGKSVTILEMQDKLAPDATVTHRTELLMALEAENNLNCITGSVCSAITEKTVTYRIQDKTEKQLPADTVVLAVGMQERLDHVEAFRPKTGRFISIGDCTGAANVEKAIYDAFCAVSRV